MRLFISVDMEGVAGVVSGRSFGETELSAATAAIARIEEFKPFVIGGPLQVEFELTNHALAETLCYINLI